MRTSRRVLPVIVCSSLLCGQANIRLTVELVHVPCIVTDAYGRPVEGLRANDFIMRDNGVGQEITYLWQELDLPLTIGLVADVSGSQRGFIAEHRETILQLLRRVISPRDVCA